MKSITNIITNDSIEKAIRDNKEKVIEMSLASALLTANRVQNDCRLAALMGLKPSLSNQQATAHWVRTQLKKLKIPIEDVDFDALRTMFESYLYSLNDY